MSAPPAENSPIGSAGEAEVSRPERDELKTSPPDDVARLVERLKAADIHSAVDGPVDPKATYRTRPVKLFTEAASLITTQAQRIEELTAELEAARNEALLEVDQTRAQSQPIAGSVPLPVGEAEEPAAALDLDALEKVARETVANWNQFVGATFDATFDPPTVLRLIAEVKLAASPPHDEQNASQVPGITSNLKPQGQEP